MSIAANDQKLLSIIVPVFNEEKNVGLFYQTIKKVLNTIDFHSELIFIN